MMRRPNLTPERPRLATGASTTRGWRHIDRYVYVQRPYEEVWCWLAGHLSTLGDPLPDGGRSVELRIRPGGVKVSRPVRLHVGGLICGEERARAGLGWADAGHPHLFPQLEAVLELAPVPHDGLPFTQLGVLARYRPPLGPLGALGDHVVGAEVTDAALATFLDDLADAVADHIDAPSVRVQTGQEANPQEHNDPAVRRLLLTVERLGVRPGGAVGTCDALAATPGVLNVSMDPWAGLVAVDHDPTRCSPEQMVAAMEDEATARPAP
jgi:hypothetical protein